MAGNVWQWCWDRFDAGYYAESPSADPRGPDYGNGRIVRGGSWVIGAWNCRVSDRFFTAPNDRSNSWGFRLARTAPGD
jgi:formylglycine-generating enzyme required for sulfatase activity